VTVGACSKCGGPRDRGRERYCRACANEYKRRTRKRYSELPEEQRRKVIARAYAGVKQSRGAIAGPSVCAKCGGNNHLEKHHPDHGKPTEIVWLCRTPCHREADAEAHAASIANRQQRTRQQHQARPPRTHCRMGHELAGDNVYHFRHYRLCRACRRAAESARPARTKTRSRHPAA
jgi:hypothetical protein